VALVRSVAHEPDDRTRAIFSRRLADGPGRSQILLRSSLTKGGSMKRSAWTLSLLGLVGFAMPTFAQESKTQTTEQQSKSKMKADKPTKSDTDPGAAKTESSATTDTKQKAEGTTTESDSSKQTKETKQPGK